MYKVLCITTDHNGVRVVDNGPHSLGDAHECEFATRAEAEAAAEGLKETASDFGLDQTTAYSVEEV